MATQSLVRTMQPPLSSGTSPNQSKSDLIREWVLKFALNAGQTLDAAAVGVYTALWCESFEDLPANVLQAAFRKAIRACRFWPVKIADILEHVDRAKETAIGEAAERAWERVLEIRRVYWNPDAPGGFSRGKPALSPRIERAARAAGVFRDHETVEALHVWAKKKFIESFTRWDEAAESQNLLPDGEVKNLLTEFAQTKALPEPAADFHALHERGLRYSEQNKLLDTFSEASRDLPAWAPEKRAEVGAELQSYGERFKAAIEKRQHENAADNPAELQPVEVSA